MTARQVAALPWGFWWTQMRAIVRIELKKTFFNRRSWWIYLAALAPVILTAGHSIATLYFDRMSHSLSYDIRAFAGIFQFGYLRVFLFFGCALLFTNLVRGEVLNKTLHYYFLAPVRREVFAAAKYLAGLAAALTLYIASASLAHVTCFMHFGPQFEEFYLRGPGLGHLGAYAGVTALACIGYGAVFTFMGLLFKNPMIPAAVVMVWEGINVFLPPLLKKFSVIFYLNSLCPVPMAESGPLAMFIQEADPVPAYLAVPGLLLLALAAMVYAGLRIRTFEISYTE